MSSHFIQMALPLILGACLVGCGRPSADSPPQSARGQVPSATNSVPDQFLTLMNAGKNLLDQGDATNALAAYSKAAAMIPTDVDVHLNLANAYLLAGQAEAALQESEEVLKLEANSAAAYFIKGSAWLRIGNSEEAVKALENAKKIDPGETATYFQLGRARMGLKQWEEAITAFQEGLATDPNHLHAPVHYLLAQCLLRAGRQAEAERELAEHQAAAEAGGAAANAATFERSKFTLARVPFRLEQPDTKGVQVAFVDATSEVLPNAQKFSGPLGVIDPRRSGSYSLVVLEKGVGFRILGNTNGAFHPADPVLPALPDARYYKILVGDLQNDRADDVIALGDKGSHLFKFDTNGVVADVSDMSRMRSITAADGLLIDLDFTGKLDLVTAGDGASSLRIFRQFGPVLFSEITSTSGVPDSLQGAEAIAIEDWNRDGNMDLIAGRKTGAPLLLEKQRGGPLRPREVTNWPPGTVFCAGDFDNDLRPDLAIVGPGKISICFNRGERKELPLQAGVKGIKQIVAVDYDNDGWLDLWAVGEGIRAWRNLGLAGFVEKTTELGLEKLAAESLSGIRFADFDGDCDPDAVIALANGGLRYLRNDGGNGNHQLKVQLIGNRSNASGIGCRVEIETGGLRLIRTVQSLPVEIGVGKYQTLDSFLVHWFNWPQGSTEVPFNCREPLLSLELTIQEGSCPYLYAWDGKKFRFVTDILGAAPLGLPAAEGRYIEADPEEYVWIGNEELFRPRDGYYEVRITEELREVLYLDEAKLVVVDRDPGNEVHPTDKLLPGKPFPPGALLAVHNEHPLLHAEAFDGRDVTSQLHAVDGRRVSPPKLRAPQLRGLAEPHGVILDFGALDTAKPLVLVMNGWLRFGGGMANIAASHDPALPFPFPVLEAEVAPGEWKSVDVTVGAPAGKTKTILVDLEGKLAPGTRRLRLSQAFEIHWDRIALMEKEPHGNQTVSVLAPAVADLHFRGFSAIQKLPADCPLTPDYERVDANGFWTITPGGWCTRYGDVSELIATRDEGLLLMNAGDELTLKFPAGSLPEKKSGAIREFFLYADGWDKDSDFHVAAGTTVEPLPFHGMNDQSYGAGKRPPFPSDALNRKYNTRWVEGRVLRTSSR